MVSLLVFVPSLLENNRYICSMKKIGITGGIGVGKSFVGKILRERGFQVMDADCVIHELYRENESLREEILDAFGVDALTNEGVDRKFFADLIFRSEDAREQLESIVYPYLIRTVEEFFEENCHEDAADIFVEAALFSRVPEIVDLLDEIWIVDAPEALRLERLLGRGLSRDDALRRIENQRKEHFPESLPRRQILNDGDASKLEQTISEIHQSV